MQLNINLFNSKHRTQRTGADQRYHIKNRSIPSQDLAELER